MRRHAIVAAASLIVALLAVAPIESILPAATVIDIAYGAQVGPRGSTSPQRPASYAYILMDAETGRVLAGRNLSRRMAPASATKVLTGLIAIERLPRGATVSISERAAAVRGGSVLGLAAREEWSLDDLLHGMLMMSANDAAFAIAERVAGSVERFVRLMNARSREIGATTSHFSNPNGYDATDHYVTPYDLALITRRAMQNPVFRAIVASHGRTIVRPGRPVRQIVNSNGLLDAYAGADGVKTGFTGAAGKVLVGSASRDGWRLIAVAMKSADPVADVSQLLDDGYASYQRVQVARSGQQVKAITVGPGSRTLVVIVPQDVHAAVRRGASLSSRVWINPGLRAPINRGADVGTMRFYEGGQKVAETSLVAARRVAP
jgi:serine-type D-Ala-D-Ala carboxypeptidase (penicillin-binding protein 5/6)